MIKLRKISVIIKTSTAKIDRAKRIISRGEDVVVISINKYIQCKLAEAEIKSMLLEDLSIFKTCRDLQGFMDKQYGRLCVNASAGLDYADIFRNHLCWETQKAFYFMSCFENLRKKYKVEKVYFEVFPKNVNSRFSKSIDRLFSEYFKGKRMKCEKL